MGTKETVILVHGTFAQPRPGVVSWYAGDASDPDSYVGKLNEALRIRGSEARCWAHCPDCSQTFSWTGKNEWTDRAEAASILADYINHLKANGWFCHIVAHSHAGNVVIDALRRTKKSDAIAEPGITVACLGTPFMNAMAPVSARRRHVSLILFALACLALLLSMIGGVLNMERVGFEKGLMPPFSFSSSEGIFFLVIMLLAFMGVASPILLKYFKQLRQRRSEKTFADDRPTGACILAIGSRHDEAWQLLHRLRNEPNPIAPKAGLLPSLFQGYKSEVSRRRRISKVYGARTPADYRWQVKFGVALFSFLFVATILAVIVLLTISGKDIGASLTQMKEFANSLGFDFLLVVGFIFLTPFTALFTYGPSSVSAYFWPFRLMWRCVAALAAVPTEVGNFIVRSRGWGLAQRTAFGLRGYPYDLPEVRIDTTGMDWSKNCIAEELPHEVIERATKRREQAIVEKIRGLSDLLSLDALPGGDIQSVFADIETNVDLVHYSYVRDQVCIDRVADWIAFRSRELPDGMAKANHSVQAA